MADNILVTPGTGASIAADLIGTSLHQRIKISVGNDGTNDGDVSLTNPLPITGSVLSGVHYAVGATGVSTGTGTLFLGVNVDTAQPIKMSSDGTVFVTNTGTQVISGVISTVSTLLGTIAVSQTGTQNVTIAGIPSFILTHNSTQWNAYAVNTTSGAATIIKTSGAHTLYITDLLVSVNVPSMISLLSAATTITVIYLASQGGVVMALRTPMVLGSNQSLSFQPSVSGSCSAWAAGYTVT